MCGWPRSGTAGWGSAPAPAAGSSEPGGPRPRPTPPACSEYMNQLESDARVRELQRALAETTESISWRITAPLRWLGRRDATAQRWPRPSDAVIAFGSRSGALRRTDATPSPACAWPPSPTPSLRVRGRGPTGRTYNLVLDAAAERDDLEALVLVHPHTEIVDPASAPRSATRWPIQRSGWSGRGCQPGPQHRLVGGLGDLVGRHPALPGARRRRAAGDLLGPPRRTAGRGRGARRPAAGAVAVGGTRPALRRGRCSTTASTSTSASASAAPDASCSSPTCSSSPPVARADRRSGRVDRGSHPDGREVGRSAGAVRRRRGGLEGARQVRRGQARGGPGARVLGEPQARRQSARARARAGGEDRQLVLASDGAAAGLNRWRKERRSAR